MSPEVYGMWIGLMLLGFAGSALFSGIETGTYRLDRVRLHLAAQRGDHRASLLRRLLAQQTSLLSTLLIGNNIANYLGTASLAVLLRVHGVGDVQAIVLNTLIVTPILFVFGETLPKDTFASHAEKLTYPLARLLAAFKLLFTWTGLVPVVVGFSHVVLHLLGQSRGPRQFHPRRQVGSLVQEGAASGLISDEQARLVERALELTQRVVRDEMVPWAKVTRVKAAEADARLPDAARTARASRVPIVADGGLVQGMLDLDDWLRRAEGETWQDLLREPVVLPADTPVRAALGRLRQQPGLAVVTQDGRPVGVVTMKDLVEPIIGELADW
jgi:CBS domain containing-hemolysin-like protein